MSLLGYSIAAAQGKGARGGWMEYRYMYDAPNLNSPEVIERYFIVGVHFYNNYSFPRQLRIFDAVTGETIINRTIQVVDSQRSGRYITRFFDCPATRRLNDTCDEKIYDVPITVPVNQNGYVFSLSTSGRDTRNVNIDFPTYTGMLNVIMAPGIIDGVDYHVNTTPILEFNDTVIVCRNTPFTYQVQATDINSDSLSYELGDAITNPQDTTSPPLTPVNDGKNDMLKPILLGVKKLDFFTVYNRLGQVMFTTSDAGRGWNGSTATGRQVTEAFVYTAQGTDYTGKKVFKKGTVLLLR